MVWVRLDDAFGEHPKIAALSDSALALWVTSLAYCNRNLTDGFIPSRVGLGQLRYCEGNAVPAVRELEESGLWDQVPNGWAIHDFPDYQPTRDQVLAEREAARERKAKSRRTSRRDTKSDSPSDTAVSSALPVPVPVPVPEPEPSLESTSKTAPNSGAVTEDWQYLLDQLLEKDWSGLTHGGLKKLERIYGHAVVDSALREAHGYSESAPLRAYPYLESICVRKQSEWGAA